MATIFERLTVLEAKMDQVQKEIAESKMRLDVIANDFIASKQKFDTDIASLKDDANKTRGIAITAATKVQEYDSKIAQIAAETSNVKTFAFDIERRMADKTIALADRTDKLANATATKDKEHDDKISMILGMAEGTRARFENYMIGNDKKNLEQDTRISNIEKALG